MYRPILPNGKRPELPWQLFFLKLNLCWPLREDISATKQFLHDAWTMLVVVFYLAIIHADYLFIAGHFNDLELVTESLCTTFIGIMIFSRILHLQFNRKRIKAMFEYFFERVYVSREEDKELFLQCKKALRPMNVLAVATITPLIIFLVTPLVIISRNYTATGKPFPYKLDFAYDAQKPIPYAITLFYTSWVGVGVSTIIAGENTLIKLIFFHLEKRFMLVHREIQEMLSKSLIHSQAICGEENPRVAYAYFTSLLKAAIQRQVDTIRFARNLEDIFSPMTVIVLVFSALLLCVVAFQLAAHGINLTTSRYIFWLCACLFEIHILSDVGQRLIDSSEQVATEYYMCNWEYLIQYGGAEENIRLLKTIQIAMARSQVPVHITALKFAVISLSTFLRVIHAAISYFMFLIAMKDINAKAEKEH